MADLEIVCGEVSQVNVLPVELADVVPEASSESAALKELIQKINPASYGMKRTYSTIDISADKWLLINDPNSVAKLENPPSLADGISREMEKDLRYLGCELIQSGAILLKLPQTAAATGQILFQRYYYQRSFVRCNLEHTVMACLLLASKIEEEPRRPRDVINVYNRLKQLHNRRYSANPDKKLEHLTLDHNYVALKSLVIKTERRILNVLGFVVHVHHPHKLIYVYLHSLNMLESKEMLQKAWSFMNDGLRTDIFLRYRPETIACACIHLAARTIDKPVMLPKTPFPWFELFDASDRDVKAICQVLLQLYTINETPRLSRLSAYVEKLYIKMQPSKPEKIEKPSNNGSVKALNDLKKILSEKSRNTSPSYNSKKRSPKREKSGHRSRDRDYSRKRDSKKGDRSPKRSSKKYDSSPRSKKSKHSKSHDPSVNGSHR